MTKPYTDQEQVYHPWTDENAGFPEPEVQVDRPLRAIVWRVVVGAWIAVAVGAIFWSLS